LYETKWHVLWLTLYVVTGLPASSATRLYRLLLACLEADTVASKFTNDCSLNVRV